MRLMDRFRMQRTSPLRIALQGTTNAMVGGQAVMEGVMMRTPHHWAVAVRRFDGDIVIVERDITPFAERHRWARLPIMRGVIALGESLGVGYRALNLSAQYAAEWYDEESGKRLSRGPIELGAVVHRIDGEPATGGDAGEPAGSSESGSPGTDVSEDDPGRGPVGGTDDAGGPSAGPVPASPATAAAKGGDGRAGDGNAEELASTSHLEPPEYLSRWHLALSMILALGLAIGLFKLLPLLLTGFVADHDEQALRFVVAEGAFRIAVFCAYLGLVGLLPDLRRVFQYHSAEHKSINAFEQGVPLDPVRVNEQSRIHVRCGTAFLLWVFVVAIIVFGIYGWLRPDAGVPELVMSRIVFLPLIAGLSFELIRWAGRRPNNRLVRGVLAPGLWLQYLTTRECTPDQCEVAIRSLESVLGREAETSGPEWLAVGAGDDPDAVEVMA